jgi:hypothetical protein
MYGQLPSYILANGTHYDIIVANALAEYEQRQMHPSELARDLTQEDMLSMINSVRNAQ